MGQRAHDFGWNGHFEGEAVRMIYSLMSMLWGELLDTIAGYGLRTG